jgi:hypothetical protein
MDLSLSSLIVYLIIFIAGAFLGVLLGRRSKTANEAVNRSQAEFEEWKKEWAEWKANKGKQ